MIRNLLENTAMAIGKKARRRARIAAASAMAIGFSAASASAAGQGTCSIVEYDKAGILLVQLDVPGSGTTNYYARLTAPAGCTTTATADNIKIWESMAQ